MRFSRNGNNLRYCKIGITNTTIKGAAKTLKTRSPLKLNNRGLVLNLASARIYSIAFTTDFSASFRVPSKPSTPETVVYLSTYFFPGFMR